MPVFVNKNQHNKEENNTKATNKANRGLQDHRKKKKKKQTQRSQNAPHLKHLTKCQNIDNREQPWRGKPAAADGHYPREVENVDPETMRAMERDSGKLFRMHSPASAH